MLFELHVRSADLLGRKAEVLEVSQSVIKHNEDAGCVLVGAVAVQQLHAFSEVEPHLFVAELHLGSLCSEYDVAHVDCLQEAGLGRSLSQSLQQLRADVHQLLRLL